MPVIYIGGKKIGGCDDLKAAASNGRLDQALKEAGVLKSKTQGDAALLMKM